MSVFDRLKTTRIPSAPVIAIYGTPGVGKTSLASEAPSPVYLYVAGEEPPDGVEMPNDEIKSFTALLDTFSDLLTENHDFKTVIIDSLDKVEPMVWEHTCQQNGWDTIDSNDKGSPTSFGKGYLGADVFWREYFEAVSALSKADIAVVQILHTETKAFNDPLVDAYDRYRPKLQKRALDLVVENCKGLFFINRRTSVKQIDKGFGKKEAKPEGMSGAERVIHTDERAGFLAKSRFNGMPAQVPYKAGHGWSELSKYFAGPANENDAAPARRAA